MGKNIVVCCDGTGQKFELNKANPLRLHYCLRNGDGQVSFYDPGVGTLDPDGLHYDSGWFGDIASSVRQTLKGQGRGVGIVRNIQDVYRYLMQVFNPGDNVYLFGFSRGAFTAQAVAGMLEKCGLLGAYNDNLIPYATQIYLARNNARIAREFKATMARPCRPKMLGVWDTVKSLGSCYDDDYFYDSNGVNCEYGFHALSIDEKREDFRPRLWKTDRENLVQVWFPGVHSDVGGGYPEDGLANCALRWMIDRARDKGVTFDEGRVASFEPDYAGKLHDSYEGGWLLLGAEVRDIREGAVIHSAAVKRYIDAVDGYAPGVWPVEYKEAESPWL